MLYDGGADFAFVINDGGPSSITAALKTMSYSVCTARHSPRERLHQTRLQGSFRTQAPESITTTRFIRNPWRFHVAARWLQDSFTPAGELSHSDRKWIYSRCCPLDSARETLIELGFAAVPSGFCSHPCVSCHNRNF
jgi:hypothetical protein